MFAEIILLRLDAAVRGFTETAPIATRFVPVYPSNMLAWRRPRT